MFRITDLQSCLTDLIGIRREANPSFSTLYPSLLTSDSGIYLQGLHPLFNLNTLYSIAEDFSLYTYPAYAGGTTYTTTSNIAPRVLEGGLLYESLVSQNLGNAVSDTTKWKQLDFFSEWLLNIFKDSATKTINDVITAKKLNDTTKTILSDINLYDGYGIPSDKILKSSRFVFLEIAPKFGTNITIKIKNIAGQFDSTESFNLYIYHSSQSDPLYTIPVTFNKNYSMQSFTLPINTNLSNYNGYYYIGYYEDELVGQAIEKRNYYWGKYVGGNYHAGPCGGCNPTNTKLFGQWGKYLNIAAGYVREADQNAGLMWDIEKNVYNLNTNWGLNLMMSVECDVTDFLCNVKDTIANALGKRIAIDMLEQIAFNQRNNIVSEQTRSRAYLALDDRNTSTGVKTEYKEALKALSFDLSAISNCLPCNQKQVIHQSAI